MELFSRRQVSFVLDGEIKFQKLLVQKYYCPLWGRVPWVTAGSRATRARGRPGRSERAAASGVSIDEESINLINYQKQYEGSARVISVARELLDTLLASV